MKKSVALILAFILIIGLCACGNSSREAELSTDVTQTATFFSTTETTTETVIETTGETVSQALSSSAFSTETMTVDTLATTETSQKETTTTQNQTSTEIQTTEPVSTTETQVETITVKTTQAETKKADNTTTRQKETTLPEKNETEKASTESKQLICTVEIACDTILENSSKLKPEKKPFVPKNGKIINSVSVSVPKGSTVFDVIKKSCEENTCSDNCIYCKKNGVHFDYVYTPGYDSYYIRGVHQIYEKDCGTQSGWMYCVNDVFPNFGCNKYKVKNGDVIRLLYTCDLGEDIGNIA